MDRVLGLGVPPAFTASISSHSAAVGSGAVTLQSPLASIDGFRVPVAQFENLSGCAPPQGISDLVYGDAFLVALGLSRRPEVRAT